MTQRKDQAVIAGEGPVEVQGPAGGGGEKNQATPAHATAPPAEEAPLRAELVSALTASLLSPLPPPIFSIAS